VRVLQLALHLVEESQVNEDRALDATVAGGAVIDERSLVLRLRLLETACSALSAARLLKTMPFNRRPFDSG